LMAPKNGRSPADATRLAAFLVSTEGQALARERLTPPDRSPAAGHAFADQLLAQASVSPFLLSLQDTARRRHLIAEWRQAIAATQPSGAPTPTSTR